MFNEIWQIRDYENINITGFKLATICQRNNQRGGGVLIYVRDTMVYKLIEAPIVEGTIEMAAIEVDNSIIAVVYRPPSGNKEQFKEVISEWITSNSNKNVYIAGDFNLNINSRDKTIFDSITALTGLEAKINEVTRVQSNSSIDNIITNIEGMHKVSSICIADHQGLISTIRITAKSEKPKQFKYREMKESNWNKFSIEIKKLTIKGNNINEKWHNLCEDIKDIVNLSFPEKFTSKKYNFTMSQGLLKSKNKKNKLLKQYKRGLIEKEVYIRYNKIYRKLITKEQEKSFSERIIQSGHDSKKKWRVLKEELKLQETKENIEAINFNGQLLTNPQEIANSFKSHFETCASKLANEVPDSGDNDILIEQKPGWEFHSINEEKLEKIIDSILPKNSSGFDNLSNKMLKREKKVFTKLLINLINETLTNGVQI